MKENEKRGETESEEMWELGIGGGIGSVDILGGRRKALGLDGFDTQAHKHRQGQKRGTRTKDTVWDLGLGYGFGVGWDHIIWIHHYA